MQNAIAPDFRILIDGESQSEYRKHLDGLVASLQPADDYEAFLVEEFATAAWAWRRARAVEAAHLHHVGTSYYRGPQGIAEALFHVPDKHFRNHRNYMLDAERRYERARRAVEEIRRRRDRGTGAIPAVQNEPKPATPAWPDLRVQNEPNRQPQMPRPARRGDAAIRKLVEIAERKSGT